MVFGFGNEAGYLFRSAIGNDGRSWRQTSGEAGSCDYRQI